MKNLTAVEAQTVFATLLIMRKSLKSLETAYFCSVSKEDNAEGFMDWATRETTNFMSGKKMTPDNYQSEIEKAVLDFAKYLAKSISK